MRREALRAKTWLQQHQSMCCRGLEPQKQSGFRIAHMSSIGRTGNNMHACIIARRSSHHRRQQYFYWLWLQRLCGFLWSLGTHVCCVESSDSTTLNAPGPVRHLEQRDCLSLSSSSKCLGRIGNTPAHLTFDREAWDSGLQRNPTNLPKRTEFGVWSCLDHLQGQLLLKSQAHEAPLVTHCLLFCQARCAQALGSVGQVLE